MATPRGYDNVVRRVLEIPEILDHVFSFLDNQSNTKNALVCKKWCEPALNNMWRDVLEPHILFGLLAPLKLSPLLRERNLSHYVCGCPSCMMSNNLDICVLGIQTKT